jgi:CRP-like cAMP-binding protein
LERDRTYVEAEGSRSTLQPTDESGYGLAGAELFGSLPPEQLQAFEARCRWHTFDAGQTIIERDENRSEVYFVVEGTARVVNYLADGREVVLADVGAGSFFGELSGIDCLGRSAFVVAREQTVAAVLGSDDFMDLLRDCPDAALKLIHHLTSVIRSANERVSALVDLSPHQRIYAELVRLANPSAVGDGSWTIDPLPMHSEISGWAGTNSEVVSLAVGTLIREGVARRRDKSLIIHDFPRLKMLTGI